MYFNIRTCVPSTEDTSLNTTFSKSIKGILFTVVTVSMIVLGGCKQAEETPPVNPFTNTDKPIPTPQDPNPDSATITGLHKYIFSVKCANPGCHDGHFEPDFRTVQSSYSTMIYQPVTKNTPDSRFVYRVIPDSVHKSWLHERVTTEDAVLGRMPLYDKPLNDSEMAALRKWIADGAKDPYGNRTPRPNQNAEPNFYGPAIFTLPDSIRLDTTRRGNILNPLHLPQNTDLQFFIGMWDTDNDWSKLRLTGMQITGELDNYERAFSFTPQYHMPPAMVRNLEKPGENIAFLFSVKLNTRLFTPGKTYYFRFQGNDGAHDQDTYFPHSGTPPFFKFYYSFVVE